MLKKLLRDYLWNWKPGRLKELYRTKSNQAFMIVLLPLYMGLGLAGEDNTASDVIMECALLIPMAVVYYSILLHPLRLPKMYYLCPMTRQERLTYVRHSYLVQSAVHMILFLCGLAVLVVLVPVSHVHILSFLLLFLDDLLVSVLVLPGEQDDTGWIYTVALPIGYLFLNMVQLVVLSDDKSHWFALAASYAVFLLVEVPMFIGYMKHIRRQLADVGSYEGGQ
jgi:hypothetical protein